MKQNRAQIPRSAFTLVEVVISLGIVSFALLAIFALFGTSLRSASETVSQQEILGITRSLADVLRSGTSTTSGSNAGLGYKVVSEWVENGSYPVLLAFSGTDGIVKTGTNITAADTALSQRSGRLYRLVPSLSRNVPGISSFNDLANQAFIPLQIKIYEVPTLETGTNNRQPVFTYETSVFR